MHMKKTFSIVLACLLLVSAFQFGVIPASAEQKAPQSTVRSDSGSALPDEISVDTLTEENAMLVIYSKNNLSNVLQEHGNVRAVITSYGEDQAVDYSKTVEIQREDENVHVRIHHESDILTGEMEGSTKAGYIACRWNDGSTEVACSYPDEFLPLTQETYLEPYENVTFDNVSWSMQDDVLVVTALMHYNNGQMTHSMVYYVDPDDFHLLAVNDEALVHEGSAYNLLQLSYDEDSSLEECTVLDDVMNADDAKTLNIVYVAPEYNFTQVKSYTISESVVPNLDSRGYFNLYTSADLNKDSAVDNIVIDGDTTVYAVLTTYMLEDQQEQAAEAAAVTPAPTPSSEQKPAVTPAPKPVDRDAITITKNPTSETLNEGGSAYFTAAAKNATSTYWSFISPDGSKTVLATEAANYFGGLRIYGCGTGTLGLENIPVALDQWTIRCTFSNTVKTVTTESATLTVKSKGEVAPSDEKKSSDPAKMDDKDEAELRAVAERLMSEALEDVHQRVSHWGWEAEYLGGFYYAENVHTGYFDLEVYNGNRVATFHFRAYPVMEYYLPVSVDAIYAVDESTSVPIYSRTFPSTTDAATCWASFGDSLVAITNADVDVPEDDTDVEPQDLPDDEPQDQPEAEPEEEPVEEPEETFVSGVVIGSGSFCSPQSDRLVLHLNWTATTDTPDTVLIKLVASVQSYSIYTVGRPLTLSVGNMENSFMANGFDYSTNDVHYTPVGTYTYRVSAYETSVPVMASWNFNGTYSGQDIGLLVCGGTATFSAPGGNVSNTH